ncbi:right-handed parallel beta-helix repeat-containing protein [Alienimonas chondri]|uniref:Right handed beta helix domain-containing protein n=1 Tax=Alienimonas chondri TaxID=2681879 RepID=A0ABX1VHI0_9PLAN|nr:right-handed parallel beta-helix repeat-containing protein [Alienimonas chondri]NNJ27567.1 hypothetical protein [Alienimonas chondri]
MSTPARFAAVVCLFLPMSVGADSCAAAPQSAGEPQAEERRSADVTRIDRSIQLADNPPMQVRAWLPPEPPVGDANEFEIREGFRLVDSLDELRAALREDGGRIRLKPGVYRPETPERRAEFERVRRDGRRDSTRKQGILHLSGSENYLDLRGVTIEFPFSVQGELNKRPHVSSCWLISGRNNTLEGGDFRDVGDRDYPDYFMAENQFEVLADGVTFRDCTFVTKGSIPYGYSDYYGKGGPNFGRLNKHGVVGLGAVRNSRIVGCRFYNGSFGHCLHFHGADGVLVEDCYLTGALRPTADILRETVGRAVDYDYHIMFRGRTPIPGDQMIPLTEDAIRTYNDDKNIVVRNTVVERHRGGLQLLCEGDVLVENVTIRECGDFGFDLSGGKEGRVVMRNCFGDLAYNPLFNLSRGRAPDGGFFELTLIDPADDVRPTPRTSLGTICGDACTFVLHDRTTRESAPETNVLLCGGRKPLRKSTISNYGRTQLVLKKNVEDCTIITAGEVVDEGQRNRVIRIEPMTTPTPAASAAPGQPAADDLP